MQLTMTVNDKLFRQHPLFMDIYVSDDGQVFNGDRGRFIAIGDNGNGYQYIHLPNKYWYIQKNAYVHRLVLEAHYFELIPENMEGEHRDRDRSNNSIDNLRIVDRTTNMYNTSTTKAVLVDKLPKDAVSINEFEEANYENYYYSHKNKAVYWNNINAGEIVRLNPYRGAVTLYDTDGVKHVRSIRKIGELFEQ